MLGDLARDAFDARHVLRDHVRGLAGAPAIEDRLPRDAVTVLDHLFVGQLVDAGGRDADLIAWEASLLEEGGQHLDVLLQRRVGLDAVLAGDVHRGRPLREIGRDAPLGRVAHVDGGGPRELHDREGHRGDEGADDEGEGERAAIEIQGESSRTDQTR